MPEEKKEKKRNRPVTKNKKKKRKEKKNTEETVGKLLIWIIYFCLSLLGSWKEFTMIIIMEKT